MSQFQNNQSVSSKASCFSWIKDKKETVVTVKEEER